MIYLLIFVLIVLLVIIYFASVQLYYIVFRGFAPFISTKFNVILTILNDLNLNGDEHVYELGSGKAGFLRAIEQKFGNTKLTGVEYASFPYFLSKLQIILANSKINLIKKNLFKVDLKPADVIYCFLMPEMMERLEKKIQQECRPETLIISYCFKLPNIEPERVLKEGGKNIYFYRI